MANGVIPNYALRGSTTADLPGAIGISRSTFVALEKFIDDNVKSLELVRMGSDLLVRTMAMATKAGAQRRSMGPVAPGKRSNPALAYRIPVQRVTGAYFGAWTVQRIGHEHWLLYNDSREAYLIETGMHMRVRRPILKMSVIGMLAMIQTTRTAEKMMDSVLAPIRNERGQFTSFASRLRSGVIGGMSGPQGNLP